MPGVPAACRVHVTHFPPTPVHHRTQHMTAAVREDYDDALDGRLPLPARRLAWTRFDRHAANEIRCAMHTGTRPHPRAHPHGLSHPSWSHPLEWHPLLVGPTPRKITSLELQFLAVCADPSGSLATYAERLKTCYT